LLIWTRKTNAIILHDAFDEEWRESFWDSNYARLLAVKDKYDPDGGRPDGGEHRTEEFRQTVRPQREPGDAAENRAQMRTREVHAAEFALRPISNHPGASRADAGSASGIGKIRAGPYGMHIVMERLP
jgi:hypothetical protein